MIFTVPRVRVQHEALTFNRQGKTTTDENEFAEQTQPAKVQWSTLKHRYALKLEQVQFNQPQEFE